MFFAASTIECANSRSRSGRLMLRRAWRKKPSAFAARSTSAPMAVSDKYDRSVIFWIKKSAQLCFDHFFKVTGDNSHFVGLAGCPADEDAPFDHGEHEGGEFLIIPVCFENALPDSLGDDIDDQLLASID